MSKEFDKQDLVKYRIKQAEEAAEEISLLIENKLYKTAINRIYYGMFYALLALALKHNFKTSKHRQLIGWFNKDFIKTGVIDISYGRIINNAFENRSDSDYGLFVEFTLEDITEMHQEMKAFIKEIKKHIF